MFKNLQTITAVDILVIGAGSSGCMAALAAAANKKYSVLLVERYGFAGGTSTQMLDTFYGFFTPREIPKKIVGGLPDTVVNELDHLGEIFLRPNTYGAGTGVNYNPERLKNVWDHLLQQAGVNLLLHTVLIEVNQQSNGQYECIFWNKGGFWKATPKRVIDASGDADFCHLAGFKYELAGELEPAQSMTTTFRMGANLNHVVLSHVDRNKDLAYQIDLMQTGISVEYDSSFRWKPGSPNYTYQYLEKLLPMFPNQITVGMDAARNAYWKSYGGKPGLDYLLTTFKDEINNRNLHDYLDKLFIENPARIFSFENKNSSPKTPHQCNPYQLKQQS